MRVFLEFVPWDSNPSNSYEARMPELIDVSGKNILITDDNPVNVQLIKSILEKNGYCTASTDNGKDCIDMAARINPDLILLDIMMPETSGIEVCRVLTETQSTQNIPVIFVSALIDYDEKIRAFKSGAVDYITKPYHLSELNARIKAIYRRKNFQNRKYIECREIKIDTDACDVFVCMKYM